MIENPSFKKPVSFSEETKTNTENTKTGQSISGEPKISIELIKQNIEFVVPLSVLNTKIAAKPDFDKKEEPNNETNISTNKKRFSKLQNSKANLPRVRTKKIEEEDFFNNNKNNETAFEKTKLYKYEGQTLDGKIHGYGRIIKPNFALYEGQFVKNKRDGLGLEIYNNSDVYVGQFKKDKKHGLGIYFFAAGAYFQGFFESGERCGFGVMRNRQNKITYRGFWEKNMKQGKGKEFYKNGNKYDGFFEKDIRHGVGNMEYSKSLGYLGEWKNGMKHGRGKVDNLNQTISGTFFEDEFKEPGYFNFQEHSNIISQTPNYLSVNEFIKSSDFQLKSKELTNVSQIYNLVKESLISLVLSLVENSTLRMFCYQLVKNIFFSSVQFETVIKDISLYIKYEPSLEKIKLGWNPQFNEFLSDKINYFYKEMSIKCNSTNVVFDQERKGLQTLDIQLEELDTTTKLVITNQVITGKKNDFEIEGVVQDLETAIRFYEDRAFQCKKKAIIVVYPFFLFQKIENLNFVLHFKVNFWVGEFYFGKDQKSAFKLKMVLSEGDDGTWYSVGVDEIGVFVLAGRIDKLHMTGTLVQEYVQNYKIEYEMFLVTNDKLQGTWNTTKMNGHFILRKDTTLRFNQELSKVLKEINSKNKLMDFSNHRDSETVKNYMNQSILSVIIKKCQGGPPISLKNKDDKTDFDLFEKFKKMKEDDIYFGEKSLKSTSFVEKKYDIKPETAPKLSIDIKLADAQISTSPLIAKNSYNLTLFKPSIKDELINNKDENDSKEKNWEELKNHFETSANELRHAFNESFQKTDKTTDQNDERIYWIGHIETFGKKEVLVFDNMYILSEIIEGVLTDSDQTIYELAGSYSCRTKQFELIGMSSDKKKTIKIKGSLSKFTLKGELMRRMQSENVSSIEIVFFGIETLLKISFKNENTVFENVEGRFKWTEHFLYGMIHFENDTFFVNGVWHQNVGYVIETSSYNKQINNNVLTQVKNEGWNNKKGKVHYTFESSNLIISVQFG